MKEPLKALLFFILLIGNASSQLGTFTVSPSDRLVVEASPSTTSSVSLTISNNNGEGFTLNGATLDGTDASLFSFTKSDGTAASPSTFSATSSISFLLSFAPGANNFGVKVASLTLTFDSQPSLVIPVRGLAKRGLGGDLEPSLQWIMDSLHFTGYSNVGDDDPTTVSFNSGGRAVWSSYPLGPEIVSRSFVTADPLKNVTVEALACYGPNKSPGTTQFPTTELGVCPPKSRRDSTGCTILFQVADDQGQTMNPTTSGLTYFLPGANVPFSFYSRWPNFDTRGDLGSVYMDEDLNTFANALPHHVRVYPYQTQEGAVVENAYVLIWEEYTDVVDFQDLIVLVRNVVPSSPLQVSNPLFPLADAIPLPAFDSLHVGFQNNSQTASLVIRNPSSVAVQLLSVSFSDSSFSLSSPTLPLTVAASQTQTLVFSFASSNPSSSPVTATAQFIVQNAAGNTKLPSSLNVSLSALSGNGPFSVASLVSSWGLSYSDQPTVSSSWTLADTSKLGAAFFLGFLSPSSNSSVLRISNNDITSAGTFSGKNVGFGISIREGSSSSNSSTLSFYPVKNGRSGKLGLFSWIVASSSSVWYISNIQPNSFPSPFSSASSPLFLSFSAPVASSLVDSSNNSIGFTSYLDSYQPSLARVDYSSSSLALTSSPSFSLSPQISFYGTTAGPVTVRAVISSISDFAASGQSFGVFLATNSQNAVKLVVSFSTSSSASIRLSYGSQDSTSQDISLPITSLVLELTVDPYNSVASASFKLGSSAFQSLSPLSLSNAATLFDTISHAGVFLSGNSFTVSFSTFNVFSAGHSPRSLTSPINYYGGSPSTLFPSLPQAGLPLTSTSSSANDGNSNTNSNTLSPSSPASSASRSILFASLFFALFFFTL